MIDEYLRALVEQTVRRVLREELGRTPQGDYLSVAEAADLASVAPQTIRGWIRSGKLPGYRAGRVWRVRRAELESLLAAGDPTTENPGAVALRLLKGDGGK